MEPPKDKPEWFEEIWPILECIETNKIIFAQLQADHEDKDVTNNVIENVFWRCPSCHKLHDLRTEKGVSTRDELDDFTKALMGL